MKVVFLDVETTGLDPAHDRILEIACMQVNGNLDPVRGFHSLVRPSTPLGKMDPYVLEMHTKNGLLASLDDAPQLHDVNKPLCDWLGALEGGRPGALTLAGNSVHFDLSFLRSWFPLAARMFSHRLFDVSALRVFREYLQLEQCPIVGTHSHRAKDDVLASIAQARWYRDTAWGARA